MKALWNDTVIAEADKDELIRIEGNWYFPPHALHTKFFQNNEHHTTCFWKGEASYYTLVIHEKVNESAAWYYPKPLPGAIKQVKQDFTNYVAFWRGVEVRE